MTGNSRVHGLGSAGIVVCLLANACGMAFLTGCDSNYPAEKQFYKVSQKLQQLNVETASNDAIDTIIREFEYIRSKWPLLTQAADAHYEIAKLYVRQGKFINARKELETLAVNFSNKPDMAANAYFTIGKIYEKEGDFESAIKTYRQLYDLYPLTKRGLYAPLYIANVYKEHGRMAEANAAYEAAIAHYTKKIEDLGEIRLSALLQNYIALTYASQEKWQAAIDAWDVIAQKYGKSTYVPASMLTVGEIYFVKLKERSKAIEKYKKVIEYVPRTGYAVQAMIKLIQIYYVTGEYAQAREWAGSLLQSGIDSRELEAQAKAVIASCFEKEGMTERATELYESILNSYGDTQVALRIPVLMAVLYETGNEKDKARYWFDEAMSEYEGIINDPVATADQKNNAYNLLNLVYVRQENWDGFLDHMQHIVDDASLPKERRAHALYGIAYIYQYKINNPEKAAEYYRNFLIMFPEHPLIPSVKKELRKLEQ